MVEPCLGRADLFETRHWPELACGTTLLDQGSNDNELGQFSRAGLLIFWLYQQQQELSRGGSTSMELGSRDTISIASDAQPGHFCCVDSYHEGP